MGILDPKTDATVNPMPARVDETVGQGARSASKALDFLGGILGQLGKKEGGGTKADAQLVKKQQFAEDAIQIGQMMATDPEGAKIRARQLQVNSYRDGLDIGDQEEDVFLAATGMQLSTALEDPEARTRRMTLESDEGRSAILVARSRLGSDASRKDVEEYALNTVKQKVLNAQKVTDGNTKWLHGGREAANGLITSFEEENIAGMFNILDSGGRLSSKDVEIVRAQAKALEGQLSGYQSDAGPEYEQIKQRFAVIDGTLDILEGLSGTEQLTQELVEAQVFKAEEMLKSGEIDMGQYTFFVDYVQNKSKYPEFLVKNWNNLPQGVKSILSAMPAVPKDGTEMAEETDPLTNTNVTYTRTGEGVVTVEGSVWGDRAEMDERLKGKKVEHLLEEAEAGIGLANSGDRNKLSDPAYRDRNAQVLSDAYYRMETIGREQFVSSRMLDKLFGGGSVSTIKAIGKTDPEVARTLSAQAQAALQTQSAHLTKSILNFVDRTAFLGVEDGKIEITEASLLNFGITQDRVLLLQGMADEQYNGDLMAMALDGASKFNGDPRKKFTTFMLPVTQSADKINAMMDSRSKMEGKIQEFGRMISTYTPGDQVKEPEVNVGDTDAALDWSGIAAGGAATRSDSFSKLEPDFALGVHQMVQDAKAEGINLTVVSAYRSAAVQAGILSDNMMRRERGGFSAEAKAAWNSAVQKFGPEGALSATYQGRTWENHFTNTPNGNSIRKWIALPGRSQHQKGRAVDFGTESGGLVRKGSKEAIWLNQNAAKYGVNIPMSHEPWQAEPVGSRDGSLPDSTTSVSNNKIGDSLGVDFAAYERDAGLPEGYLEAMAMIESSGNPGARREGSQYIGLFQLGDAVRKKYGVKDPLDPEQNTKGAVAFAKHNMKALRNVLGRDPTGPELYLAHQQGLGGATALLKNPDLPAVDALATIMDRARAEKHILANAGNLGMTSSEFADIWVRKFRDRGQFVGSGQVNADGPGGDAQAEMAIPQATTPLSRGEFDLGGMDTETDQSNRQAAVEAGKEVGLAEETSAATAIEQAAEAEATADKDKAVAQQQEAQALTRIKDIGGLTNLSRVDRNLLVRAAGSAQAASEAVVFESMDDADEAIANGQVPEGAVVFVKNEGVFINGE